MGIFSKVKDVRRANFTNKHNILELLGELEPYCKIEIDIDTLKKVIEGYQKSAKTLKITQTEKEKQLAKSEKLNGQIAKINKALKKIRSKFGLPIISRIALNILPFNKKARKYRELKKTLGILKAEDKMAQDMLKLYNGMVAEQKNNFKSAQKEYYSLVDRIISVYKANKEKMTLVEQINSVIKTEKAEVNPDLITRIQTNNLPEDLTMADVKAYFKCIEKGKNPPDDNKTKGYVTIKKTSHEELPKESRDAEPREAENISREENSHEEQKSNVSINDKQRKKEINKFSEAIIINPEVLVAMQKVAEENKAKAKVNKEKEAEGKNDEMVP